MADKLKIKLSIADRVYPLTINPQQEEGLRKAAKKIEAMIKQFEQSYAVRDVFKEFNPKTYLIQAFFIHKF